MCLAAVADRSPKLGRVQPSERRGIHPGQPRAAPAEAVPRVVERQRAGVGAGQAGVLHHARDVARRDGVGRCGQFLSRVERGKRAFSIRARRDLKPAVCAGKLVAEVQRDGEEAVAHRGGRVGERATELAHTAAGIEQRKGQVVAPIGGAGAVIEPALIGKGGALGGDVRGEGHCGGQRQACRDGQRSFHRLSGTTVDWSLTLANSCQH